MVTVCFGQEVSFYYGQHKQADGRFWLGGLDSLNVLCSLNAFCCRCTIQLYLKRRPRKVLQRCVHSVSSFLNQIAYTSSSMVLFQKKRSGLVFTLSFLKID